MFKIVDEQSCHQPLQRATVFITSLAGCTVERQLSSRSRIVVVTTVLSASYTVAVHDGVVLVTPLMQR